MLQELQNRILKFQIIQYFCIGLNKSRVLIVYLILQKDIEIILLFYVTSAAALPGLLELIYLTFSSSNAWDWG